MGNACCGGELTLPAQPGLPLQSAQILQSVLEFSESARTSEPLRDLEAAIESLLCEIDSLEGDFILARNSAESSLDRLEKDLEAFKSSPQPQFSEYTGEEKAYRKSRAEELQQWQELVESQGYRLAEATAKARLSAETQVSFKLYIVKGRAAGFQKQMYHLRTKDTPGHLTLEHIHLLEQKFTNVMGVIEGLERRMQVLKEADTGSGLAERFKALLETVLWIQTRSNSEIISSIAETGEILPESDYTEKETAVPEETTVSETPISAPIEEADFAFAPVFVEIEDLPELVEVEGLYSERQELRDIQENSQLRRFLQANSIQKCTPWDPHRVQSLFLELMHRKDQSDQEQRQAGALPLSMDTFVIQHFDEKERQEANSALLSFLKGLCSAQSAKFPGSLLISRTLNVFTAQPYPLPVAQLLPGFLRSLSSPSGSISLLELIEKVCEVQNPAEALEVLREFRPDSLAEGEFLVLLCCYHMQKLRKDNLFRLLAGDSDSLTSELLTSGIVSQLQLPFSASEQEALLSAVNSAGSGVVSRLKFNKAFNTRQLREAGKALSLVPLVFADRIMEVCIARRRKVIQDLAVRVGKTGERMEELAEEAGQSGLIAREIAGKGFGEAVAVLESHLVGPFHRAYSFLPI